MFFLTNTLFCQNKFDYFDIELEMKGRKNFRVSCDTLYYSKNFDESTTNKSKVSPSLKNYLTLDGHVNDECKKIIKKYGLFISLYISAHLLSYYFFEIIMTSMEFFINPFY